MSQPQPRPRLGVQRLPRMYGLGSRPQSIRTSRSPSLRSPSPALSDAPPRTVVRPQRPAKICRACQGTAFEEVDGATICTNCGNVQHDAGNYSNEITFAEGDSGRAQQVGTRINDNQTHQRNYIARGAQMGHVGHEAMPTSDRAKSDAKYTFNTLAAQLHINDTEKDKALGIFSYAYSLGFVRGRTIESVATVCLYLATRYARRRKDGPQYALMLIDFAEYAHMNVFDLGRMMQELIKRLYLNVGDDESLREGSFLMSAPGAEVLIDKFVNHLDFPPEDARKISSDAANILQRMKRDWLHHGRRPAGVCGAAVILAARLNNYRRTLREVVLVAKVTEFTISKRLEEFQETGSSKLSVNDFRNEEIRESQPDMDPPAYYRAMMPKTKKKRGRPRKNGSAETAAEIEGDQDEGETVQDGPGDQDTNTNVDDAEETNEGRSPKRARIDADGFAVPAIPNRSNQTSTAEPPARRGRGKPKGSKNWKAPPPTEAEIAYEAEIQNEIQEALDQNQDLDVASVNRQSEEPMQEATMADVEVLPHKVHPRHDPPGPPARSNEGNSGKVSLDPILGDDEFDDDPEVSNCLLNEAERALKERIWVTENAEWLRQDHAKRIRRELKDQHLREQGLDPDEIRRQKGKHQLKRKDGARRSGRVGDVRYLSDAFHNKGKSGVQDDGTQEGGADQSNAKAGGTSRKAADSVQAMLKQRGLYSRRINYDALLSVYAQPSENSSTSPSRSPSRDREAREDSVISITSSTADDEARPTTNFFLGNKRNATRSRASQSADQQKKKESQSEHTDRKAGSRSKSDSRSPSRSTAGSATPEAEEINKQDRQHSEIIAAPDQASKPALLPTPPTTQNTTLPLEEKVLPDEEALSDTDSPLSSLPNTPHTGSAIGTPTATASTSAATRRPPTNQTVTEDDIDSSEADYTDDDDDDDDEANPDDDVDVDAVLEGRYQQQLAGQEWDDELVEDDD